VQCRVLRVSPASYREHLRRRVSSTPRRHLSDKALLEPIKAACAQTCSAYGWPRIWRELVVRGIAVGRRRVQKLMQLHGIRAKGKRRFTGTTDSDHKLPVSPNLLVLVSTLLLLPYNTSIVEMLGQLIESIQYASGSFRNVLKEYGITNSMNRRRSSRDTRLRSSASLI